MEIIKGVYKIYSKSIPDKIYVGSTVNFTKRKQQHINMLKGNCHKNRNLQAHCNKYGIQDLKFEFLEEVIMRENLFEREQYYIDLLNPSFNIHLLAENALGVIRTEEFKRKVSSSKKGSHHRPECFAGKSQRMMGQRRFLGGHHSEEAKAKISRNHGRKRAVSQYDLEGNFIRDWDYTKLAADTLMIQKVGINMCCRNIINKSGGFKWKYKN